MQGHEKACPDSKDVDRARLRPTHNTVDIGVKVISRNHTLLLQADIGNITDPELLRMPDTHSVGNIRVNLPAIPDTCRVDGPLLPPAVQILLVRQAPSTPGAKQ